MAIEKVTATLAEDTEELTKSENTYSGELEAPEESGTYSVEVAAYDDAGNVSVANASTNPELSLEVSLWRDPKTNWVSTDRFNTEDYNRIKNNLQWLYEKAVKLWKPFNIKDMGKDIYDKKSDWPLSTFNNWEENLEIINKAILTQDYGYKQIFYYNGPFITAEELNRIESATLSMKNILERQEAGFKKLSFRLGTYKSFKI